MLIHSSADAREKFRVESASFVCPPGNRAGAVWLKRIEEPRYTRHRLSGQPREYRRRTHVTGTFDLALLIFLLLLVQPSSSTAQSIFGKNFDEFVKDNIKFSGFTENTTGLAISHGSHFFDTSNPFDMNRFTIQPEFNIKLRDDLTSFISWRFVKEPPYNMESKSRKQSVQPAANGTPLVPTYYDEYSPVPWEAILDYKPNDQLTVRWGRQFISWGEADGIRLLDLINPQDSTFSPPVAPNLFNLDETRIPSWGLRTVYTVKPESNTIFEFFALPGALETPKQRVDEFMGTNDTTDRTVKYGRWSAHPETRIPFGRLFTNPLGANAAVVPITDRELPGSASSWKLGTRILHNFGNLSAGLGYIWGYNPQVSDMVFKLAGAPSLCGPPACSPGATQLPLDLVNDRTSIYAAHFNYPITEILTLPVNTTVRGEMAFFPNKPYNISDYPGHNCQTDATTGLIAGPSCKHSSQVVEKNALRYILGFDRTTFIPFLHPDDPWRAFNLTFQLYQSSIFDHEDGIRVFSSAERINRFTTALTFRIGTGYLGDTILPDIFALYDPEGYYAVNPAITYAPPWNERMRLSLIAAIYGGHNKFKSTGLFAEKDSVFLKLRYQF